MATKVRDIMTGDPVCLPPDAGIAATARTMRDENLGSVLVTENDRLRGLVTDRDLVVRGIAAGLDPHAPIGDLCSEPTAQVSPDDDLDTAVDLMRQHAVRRLPVMDGTKPMGVITLGDLAIEKDPKSGLAVISAAEPNR